MPFLIALEMATRFIRKEHSPVMSEKSANSRRHLIDRKLVTRLRLFSMIALVMLGVILVDIVRHEISFLLAGSGLLIGVVVGIIVSRMGRLSWDEGAGKVISQIDWVGAVILVLYIGFTLTRNWLFGHWVQGAMLGVFTLAITAGSMIGRVFGMRYGIRKTLEAWGMGSSSEPVA